MINIEGRLDTKIIVNINGVLSLAVNGEDNVDIVILVAVNVSLEELLPLELRQKTGAVWPHLQLQ